MRFPSSAETLGLLASLTLLAVGPARSQESCSFSGGSGFLDPNDKEIFSWEPQAGAELYEAARSGSPNFRDGCVTITTASTFWRDPTLPPPGGALFYLDRVLEPLSGGWGPDSRCFEREIDCRCETWARSYGGTLEDALGGAALAADGGLLAVGRSRSFGAGSEDAWVLRLDPSGNPLWQRAFGGTGDEQFQSVSALSNGDFAVFGRNRPAGPGQDWDWALTRLAPTGGLVWQRTFGGSSEEIAGSVAVVPTGEIVIFGGTDSFALGGFDVWILRTNAGGDPVWQKSFGESQDEVARRAALTAAGGFVFGGDTRSSDQGGEDVFVFKSNNVGPEWRRVYGGPGDDGLRGLVEAADGDLLVVGYTSSVPGGERDGWVARLDSEGDLIWQRSYGSADGEEAFLDLVALASGHFVLVGEREAGPDGDRDVWMLEIDGLGEVVWQRRHGGTGDESGRRILAIPSGGFYVAADTSSFGAGERDLWILRTDEQGRVGPACPYSAETAVSAASAGTVEGEPLRQEFQTVVPAVTQSPQTSASEAVVDSACTSPGCENP
jgi:hypothetical protein